jgi:hypothetical protein
LRAYFHAGFDRRRAGCREALAALDLHEAHAAGAERLEAVFVPPASHKPIAWMQTTGMSDTLTPWVNRDSTTQGSKFIAIEHATDNSCDVPETIPTWQQGDHVCYEFSACGESFPTTACTFDGGHTPRASDAGSDVNWIAEESWDFFMQF